MKVFVALFALVAVASAQVLLPGGYGLGGLGGLGLGGLGLGGLGYSSLVSPYGYAAAPVAVAPVAVAPAIQSGYVAATRGSLHTAPLPQGPLAFSHHINTAPAPGTL